MKTETTETPALLNQPHREDGAGEWLNFKRFALVLALLFVATFPEILAGTRTLIYRDFGSFGYPLAHFLRESLLRGEIPFWNPYNNCGIPFLAQWNTQCLYPPVLFYVLLPLAWALPVFCILHMYWGGLGMYMLARHWTGSHFGAALAGVVFAFSGLAFNCLLWPNNVAALGWMPWVVLTAESAWTEGGRKLVMGVVAGALQMLTGAPEIILQTWVLNAVIFLIFGLAGFRKNGVSRLRKSCRALALAGLIAGMAAMQLLPFLEFLSLAHRTRDYGGSDWSMPWWGWGSFLVPLLHTNRWESGVYHQYGQYWISSYYVGAATVTLAVLGFITNRQRRTLLLALLALAALVLALGENGYLYIWLKKFVPGLGFMRFPIKLVVLAVIALPLLAAYAIGKHEEAASKQEIFRRNLILGLAGMITILAMFGLVWAAKVAPEPFDDWDGCWKNTQWRIVFVAAELVLIVMSVLFVQRLRLQLLQLLILALVWLDLTTHSPNLVLTVEPSVFEPGLARREGQPVLRAGFSRAWLDGGAKRFFYGRILADQEKDFIGRRLVAHANVNLLDDFPKCDGFYSLYPRQYQELMGPWLNSTNKLPKGLMDFLAVSHTNSEKEPFVWKERGTAMPVFCGGASPRIADPRETVEMLGSVAFDGRREVFLPIEARGHIKATNGAPAVVTVREFGNNTVLLDVEAGGPAWVTAAQCWHPAWRAYVDGVEIPIWRANHAFQAFEVPQGRHVIRIVYKDEWFRCGALIGLVCALVCLELWRRSGSGCKADTLTT